jgi:RNA polymerase sigma factor (sigma-70 family)
MQGSQRKNESIHLESVQAIRVGGGDSCKIEALAERWDKFYPQQSALLWRIAVKMKLPRAEIEDVIQDVWLAFFQNLDRFRGVGAARMSAWLQKVMHGKSVDVLRFLGRRWIVCLDAPLAERTAPSRCEIDLEWIAWLDTQLAKMHQEDPLNHALLCRHHMEGRAIAELAADADLTVNAVNLRLHRQIEKLRHMAMGCGLAETARS